MKSLIRFGLFLILFTTHFILTPAAFAENAMPWDAADAQRDAEEEMLGDEQQAESEMDSSLYGRVTNVNPNLNLLSVLPTDSDESPELEEAMDISPQYFRTDSKTTFTGIDGLQDITSGDYVTVDFYEFHSTNIATGITFEKEGEQNSGNGSSGNMPKQYQEDEEDFPGTITPDPEGNSKDLVG